MNNYGSSEIVVIIAAGVFLGVVISELVFSVLQIVLSEAESDE